MKCQRCGHPIKLGDEKCKKCGAKVKKTEEYLRLEEERAKNIKKDKIALGVTMAIFLFLVFFGSYVIFFK